MTHIFETTKPQTEQPTKDDPQWREIVMFQIEKARQLDLSDLEVQQALLLIRPYPIRNQFSSLVALMICTKLGSSQDHLTPETIGLIFSISTKKVCAEEVQIALFHRCRLLKQTPFEYIAVFLEQIEL